jgi:hypothetical protein
MAAVLADTGSPSDLRATAAVELGKHLAISHRRELVLALDSKESTVVRRAAEALGRIGDEEALEALVPLRPPSDKAQCSIAFARTLISHRLGLNRYPLKPPPDDALLLVQPENAVLLKTEPVSAAELDEISSNLDRVLPAISASEEGALRFACDKNRFLIVFNKQIHGWHTLAPLKERDAVFAVVLKRSQALHSYFVYEYILVEPAGPDGLTIFGVRASGIVTRYGTGSLTGRGIDMWLRSVDTPYSPPVELELSYIHEARRLEFVTARLHPLPTAAQKQAREPKRLFVPLRG